VAKAELPQSGSAITLFVPTGHTKIGHAGFSLFLQVFKLPRNTKINIIEIIIKITKTTIIIILTVVLPTVDTFAVLGVVVTVGTVVTVGAVITDVPKSGIVLLYPKSGLGA
jgi:hypothetical protein